MKKEIIKKIIKTQVNNILFENGSHIGFSAEFTQGSVEKNIMDQMNSLMVLVEHKSLSDAFDMADELIINPKYPVIEELRKLFGFISTLSIKIEELESGTEFKFEGDWSSLRGEPNIIHVSNNYVDFEIIAFDGENQYVVSYNMGQSTDSYSVTCYQVDSEARFHSSSIERIPYGDFTSRRNLMTHLLVSDLRDWLISELI